MGVWHMWHVAGGMKKKVETNSHAEHLTIRMNPTLVHSRATRTGRIMFDLWPKYYVSPFSRENAGREICPLFLL